jgi:type I restriction enzyme S subunit
MKKWPTKPLGEVAPIDTTPVLPTKTPDNRFFYVALENIESGTGRLVGETAHKGEGIKSNKFQFGREHVLLGKLRPYLNKVHVPERSGICSTDILPLKPNPDVLSREFLAWCLRSPAFVEHSTAKMDGGKMPRLRTPDLETYKIQVPSLAEQRRLVERIEALTTCLDQARQARKDASLQSEKVLSATLAFALEGDEEWTKTTLGAICIMKTGKTPPTSQSEYFGGDVPFVCPIDVGGSLRISTAKRSLTRIAVRDGKANLFPRGTVLLVGIGSTVGKVGLADTDVCTNQQITGLRFLDEVDTEYAAWFLTAQRAVIENAASDGGVPIINQNGMAQLPFRFPSHPAEQQRIVARLDTLAAKQAELRRLQTETEAELAAFTPALLAKAFRGEL